MLLELTKRCNLRCPVCFANAGSGEGQDLSLSEIAAAKGISRQGVHDLIKRCDKSLEDYENRLHLVAKFMVIRKDIEKIEELSKQDEVRDLAEKILENL